MVLEVRIVVILGVGYRETRRASAALVIFCFLFFLELLTLRQAGWFTVVYLFAPVMLQFKMYRKRIPGEAKL